MPEPTSAATAIWVSHDDKRFDFSLKLSDAKRLKSAGIDLFDPELIKTKFFSPLDTIELLAECTRSQWESIGYEAFVDRLTYDANSLDAAVDCFTVAMSDFFRRVGHQHVAVVVDNARRAAKQIGEATTRKMALRGPQIVSKIHEQSLAKLDREIDAALKRVDVELENLGDSSTSGPGS